MKVFISRDIPAAGIKLLRDEGLEVAVFSEDRPMTQPDLIDARQAGALWGAGLDVTNPEPMKPDNPLLSMENVAVLPHIGSSTLETRDAMARLAAMNFIQGLRGQRLPHIVNPEIYS